MYRFNIVAAGDRLTAQAAKEVMQNGGNAFDGAVAAVFAAYMAEPALTSPGGGGFLMAYSPSDEEPLLYDFFVDTVPLRADNPDFRAVEVDFKDATQVFHIGMASVAVPGIVAGLFRVHGERGRLPLSEVLKPAIRYAREGIFLSPLQASFIKLLKEIFTYSEEARKIFAPEGQLVNEKRIFKNTDYAEFLELLSSEGVGAFYAGEIADRIDRLSEENGGHIRKEDLLRYKTYERTPLKISFRNWDIYLNPPPSAGGILIAFSLLLLEDRNLSSFGSKEHVLNLLAALKTTTEFRRKYVDGKLHTENLERLLKEEKLIAHFKRLFENTLNLWGNTTHISISDREGNVVSVTTTNGEGSGYVIPGFGVMLNNMLGEEDLNPKGFFKWKPYLRLPSMMCPTLVLKGREPVLALGSAGSNRIRSAILQVLLNRLVFSMHPQEAVNKPRLHLEGEKVYIEPGFGEEILKTLEGIFGKENVVPFKRKNMFFGGVQAVCPPLGEGGGDPRRGGIVLTFE